MTWARALLLVALVGCAARRPTYVPLDLPLPAQPPASAEAVRANVRYAMERGRMPRLTWAPQADLPARSVSPSQLDRVPDEALWVAWVCSPRRMRGSELDVLLAAEDGPVALTVQVDLDGGVHLVRGLRATTPATELLTDRESALQAIAQRYGLAGVVDGQRAWTSEELDILTEALDLLDPPELALLDGLLLSRDAVSPRDARELALYDPIGEPAVIHAYDAAFAAGSWSFVGRPEAPRPAAVMTLVHEFGHVISDGPVSAAWSRFTQARWAHAVATDDRSDTRSDLRYARADLRRVGRRGPVIDAFADLRPGRLWPTAWSTDVFESFAEAFALYKTDPDALLRVAPEAHAWFDGGGHLAWRTFAE